MQVEGLSRINYNGGIDMDVVNFKSEGASNKIQLVMDKCELSHIIAYSPPFSLCCLWIMMVLWWLSYWTCSSGAQEATPRSSAAESLTPALGHLWQTPHICLDVLGRCNKVKTIQFTNLPCHLYTVISRGTNLYLMSVRTSFYHHSNSQKKHLAGIRSLPCVLVDIW